MKLFQYLPRIFSPYILIVFAVFSSIMLGSCSPRFTDPELKTAPPISTSITTSVPTIGVDESQPTPIVTARGPDLVASDPAFASLASGRLQLVEFFRFT